jgi:hypothetical protein
MSVNLYRLYAVQSFNGEKVAVYVNAGNYPDEEILSDASEIADGTKTRHEVVRNNYLYDRETKWPQPGVANLEKLTYYTRILKRANKVIEENGNITKAIFVWDTNKKNWRGTKDLYENEVFDTIKCDTPNYTACKRIGQIEIG